MASRMLLSKGPRALQAPALARRFQISARRLDAAAAPVPPRRPVGAFRGGLFGFTLGCTVTGAGIYSYVLQDYKLTNDLLTEDIHALSNVVVKVPDPLDDSHQNRSKSLSGGGNQFEMNNFGVIEIASTKTTHAPGWAYVPDTGINPSPALPSNRKRARNQPGAGPLSLSDATARQEAKVRKELELLDRDNQRDVNIPIPPRAAGAAGRASSKHTPNVRKILQSQKTFANHLDDYKAYVAQLESNPAAAPPWHVPQGKFNPGKAEFPPASMSAKRGSTTAGAKGKKKGESSAAARRRSRGVAKAEPVSEPKPEPSPAPLPADAADIEMVDAPGEAQDYHEAAYKGAEAAPSQQNGQQGQQDSNAVGPNQPLPPPLPHPLDNDPLLVSSVPPFPSDDELRALMTAPPLSYLATRAEWGGAAEDEGWQQHQRYPRREFCAVCGYWGRVRCLKCGARVCALDCLDVHREECITRYGL
ncbi:hypothetical protein P8C59_006871 [Phyllachora maydis]|uniref:HIT-type domain-containing protein n=1 Tax=Phyllachora maydis TaxID=1825666 RepID=A0AAD9I7Q7_9PEZI|nr:hypothetical protein P8C59_006871 [Phyllachora maydis]